MKLEWYVELFLVVLGMFIVIGIPTILAKSAFKDDKIKKKYKSLNIAKFLYFDNLAKLKALKLDDYKKYSKIFHITLYINDTGEESRIGTLYEIIEDLQLLDQTFENAKKYWYGIDSVLKIVNKINEAEKLLEVEK